MKKSILIAGALLVLGASAASAAGINLSWNDCGTTGVENASFACNSNTGAAFTMFASFQPPPNVNQFLTLTGQVDLTTTEEFLPAWWQHGTGQCRSTTGLNVGGDFTLGPFACLDPYELPPTGGFDYDIGFGTGRRARLRTLQAIPVENAHALDAAMEYYAFKVNLLRSKTTGTGSCAGCNFPACIVLNEIQLVQPFAAGFDPQIFNPLNRNFVTWQNAIVGPGFCGESTPTQNKSWGQIKSLYR